MQKYMRCLVREVLTEGQSDWVMVDYVIGVSEDYAAGDEVRMKTTAESLMRTLLTEGLMEIGVLGESSFESWSCTVEEGVHRFVAACEEFDWNPMGSLRWLANTEKGSKWLGFHGGDCAL